MTGSIKRVGFVVGLGALLGLAERTQAGPVLSAPYSADYTIVDLGSVPVSSSLDGGLTLEAGDPNTLLIGVNADDPSGEIDSIGVTRDASGNITGFSGSASFFASAPNIDGGLAYGPGGVLFFTQYSNNLIGEIKPGSSSPDLTVDLSSLGVASSVGGLAFDPTGALKLTTFLTGEFYDATLSPTGSGTYNITSATLGSTPGGELEGIDYVTTGSPLFSTPSLLLSDYGAGAVNAYTVDADGNPIVASEQSFITSLGGAEGIFTDPVTGNLLFSTFQNSNELYEVEGFAVPAVAAPEPSTLFVGAIAGLFGLGYHIRKRSRARSSA